MNKIEKFKLIQKEELDLYEEKNPNYGDSFSKSFDEFGLITAAIRLGDKLNRFKSLIKLESNGTSDESIRDTLVDLSNYANMTIIEMDRDRDKELIGIKQSLEDLAKFEEKEEETIPIYVKITRGTAYCKNPEKTILYSKENALNLKNISEDEKDYIRKLSENTEILGFAETDYSTETNPKFYAMIEREFEYIKED